MTNWLVSSDNFGFRIWGFLYGKHLILYLEPCALRAPEGKQMGVVLDFEFWIGLVFNA